MNDEQNYDGINHAVYSDDMMDIFDDGARYIIAKGERAVNTVTTTIKSPIDGEYITTDDTLLIFGSGATPEDARADYLAKLIQWRAAILERPSPSEEEIKEIDAFISRLLEE